MANILQVSCAADCKPTDRRPPWQWCEDHVIVDATSPMPGRWRAENSPWVCEAMSAWANKLVRTVVIMCSAQSSKTQTALNLVCWAIAEDPGPAMWVMAAKDEARQFVDARARPTFEACRPVADRMTANETLEFMFGSIPLYFAGAGSKSKMQGKPIRWLVLDEVRNYRAGALEFVLKRTRSFWNSKTAIISTPDRVKDSVDAAFMAGDQRRWHFTCPSCGHSQQLKFEQMKWDTNEATRPGGRWNFDALAETIRYECANCRHPIKDTPTERKRIAKFGKYVACNPSAPKHRVSFHWSAMLPPWVPWRSVVEEFIHARKAAKGGDLVPLKAFVNETLGEPWDDELGVIDSDAYLTAREMSYEFGEVWPEERVRFIAADRQESGGEHYPWVVRAFGAFAKSRLVAYGVAQTHEELEEVRAAYQVETANALIDSGYRTSDVYKFCAKYGWRPTKGVGTDLFVVRPKGGAGQPVRRIWDITRIDPYFGTKMAGKMRPIRLVRYADDPSKDLLAEHMTGRVGEWTIPTKVGKEYRRQVTAETREARELPTGQIKWVWVRRRKDNHYGDCEKMILVAAVASQTIAFTKPPQTSGESSDRTPDT